MLRNTWTRPKSLEGYKINPDFRNILLILEMFRDEKLTDAVKSSLFLKMLYVDEIVPADLEKCYKAGLEFIDRGHKKKKGKELIYWGQDDELIQSAIQKTTGRDICEEEYLHWWSFLAYFSEIDSESVLAQVIRIRANKGKLTPPEKEWYKNNSDIVDKQLSKEQEEAYDTFWSKFD